MSSTIPHRVVVLALDGVIPFELGIPCEVFGRATAADGTPAYDVRVCGERRAVPAAALDLRVRHDLHALDDADTVIVPGIDDPEQAISRRVTGALRAAAARGARIASICSGSFVLAAAGLLDGRRATTHWIGAAALAARFPAVSVDPHVLFVEDGGVVTSAGASAGMDMCLHLVGRDLGQAAAARAARLAVAPLRRDGGQAQFIRHEPPAAQGGLAPLLDWVLANLSQPLSVELLAARVAMSSRTFVRRFREHTGTTPLQWVLAARVRRAQELLELTADPIETVAAASGFDAAVTFRARFRRMVGVGPSAYRRRFSGLDGAAGHLAGRDEPRTGTAATSRGDHNSSREAST